MKSYDVCECGQPLRLIERPTPKPSGTQVLLKVVAAGVCHSDLHLSDGYFDLGGGKRLLLADRGIKLPMTMGHENVGEVVEAGSGAHGVKPGDVRLLHPWMGCGQCTVCRAGEEQLCLTPRSLGVFTAGGYSDFVLVPHPRYLFDIGDLPPERAAPLACSGVTTYGALKKVGPLLKSEPIVIIGAGGLGLMCLGLHKAMEGRAAIVVDIDSAKRAAAKEVGAEAVVDAAASDAVERITQVAKGPPWAVIDLVGSPATAQLALNCVRKGGKVIVVGLYGGEISVPLPSLPMRAITLQGSYTGSLSEMAELLELVRRKGLPPIPVTTRPLSEINAALADLRAGKVVGRIVLTPAA